mgnify:CR=1 FL=1
MNTADAMNSNPIYKEIEKNLWFNFLLLLYRIGIDTNQIIIVVKISVPKETKERENNAAKHNNVLNSKSKKAVSV